MCLWLLVWLPATLLCGVCFHVSVCGCLLILHQQGQPQWGASFRCWAGGAACTAHLQQLLNIR
jgi:hypothetical protein